MLKKLLATFFISTSILVVAQNLELQNSSGIGIGGKTYYFFDTGFNLAETKFHVDNSSTSAINFGAKMYETANSVPEDWQVCFGQDCRSAYQNTPGVQDFKHAKANALSSYDTLKIAPFSFGWTGGEWGVWRLTVYDTLNIQDSSSAYIYWQAGGKPAGDINSNKIIDGAEIAGDVNENGIIDGAEIEGDVNGDGIINVWEVGGDTNGNGVIDGGETPLSVNEINMDNVFLSTYPNPASSQLTIKYNVNEGMVHAPIIEVFDIVGQKVSDYSLTGKKGMITIDISNMKSGVYFYSIKAGTQKLKTERVIIK